MKVGGHNREIDYERLGATLVIAAAIILAIRTARRPPLYDESFSNRDWGDEMDFATKVAGHLVSTATRRKPEFFKHKDVPWYMPDDEDVLK